MHIQFSLDRPPLRQRKDDIIARRGTQARNIAKVAAARQLTRVGYWVLLLLATRHVIGEGRGDGEQRPKRRLDAESLYLQLILSGVGTVAACEEVGVGRKTGYRWRTENGGLPPDRLARGCPAGAACRRGCRRPGKCRFQA